MAALSSGFGSLLAEAGFEPLLHDDPADIAPVQHDQGCACSACHDAPSGLRGPSYRSGADNPLGKARFDPDAAAEQLTRTDRAWRQEDGVARITYGYLAQDALRPDDDMSYRAFSAAEIAAIERAIRLIEDVAGVDFVRVFGPAGSAVIGDGDAQMTLDAVVDSNGGRARTSFVGSTLRGAEVSIGERGLEDEGSYAFRTALHEIAHGIGLSHPGDYNGPGATDYANQAEYFEDSAQYTVMSYWSERETGADFGWNNSGNLAPRPSGRRPHRRDLGRGRMGRARPVGLRGRAGGEPRGGGLLQHGRADLEPRHRARRRHRGGAPRRGRRSRDRERRGQRPRRRGGR